MTTWKTEKYLNDYPDYPEGGRWVVDRAEANERIKGLKEQADIDANFIRQYQRQTKELEAELKELKEGNDE